MAYIPPHKRNSQDPPKPTPVPSSMIPRFDRALTPDGSISNSRRHRDRQPSSNRTFKIIYWNNSICRWFTAGSAGDGPIPHSVRLEPIDCELYERRDGIKYVALKGGVGGEIEESPWMKITERIVPDLVDCYRIAMEGSESEREVIKLSFIARTGKVLFPGNSDGLEPLIEAAKAGMDSRKQIKKSFYTNVSCAHMEELRDLVVPDIGFDFDSEKEHYYVKVSDKHQPEPTFLCKCVVSNDGEGLEICKILPYQVRHLVVDISCLYKDLDLRLLLVTRRIIKSLDDEEKECINKLLKSAVIDPDMKGGLRWPFGRESVSDRFSIVEWWHSKYKAFKSPTTKIKLRCADRFDSRSSTGEVSFEVDMKLTGISEHLKDVNVDQGLIKGMVQDAVKLIWDHFLDYNHPSA